MHSGVFSQQVELSFPDDVDWVRDGEEVSKVFISYPELFDVVHVDSDNLAYGGVVECRYSSSEFNGECPRLSTVQGRVGWDGKKISRFDHGSALERKKFPSAAA